MVARELPLVVLVTATRKSTLGTGTMLPADWESSNGFNYVLYSHYVLFLFIFFTVFQKWRSGARNIYSGSKDDLHEHFCHVDIGPFLCIMDHIENKIQHFLILHFVPVYYTSCTRSSLWCLFMISALHWNAMTSHVTVTCPGVLLLSKHAYVPLFMSIHLLSRSLGKIRMRKRGLKQSYVVRILRLRFFPFCFVILLFSDDTSFTTQSWCSLEKIKIMVI